MDQHNTVENPNTTILPKQIKTLRQIGLKEVNLIVLAYSLNDSLFGSFNIDKTSVFLKISVEHMEELFNNPIKTKISSRLAFRISKQFNIPLHPMHTYFWTNINKEDLLKLGKWLLTARIKKEDNKVVKLILENSEEEKQILEKIGTPHLLVNKEYVVFEKDHAMNFYNIFLNKKHDKI